MGFGDGSGISWTICKQSASRCRQIATPTPHHIHQYVFVLCYLCYLLCVICLEWGAHLHMPIWCHCHSLSLASVISRLVLPFWYRLTRVVLDKGSLNGCVCVCVLLVPSVLWHCWLGGRKGIWPVKNWVVGCWHGHLSGAMCRLAYGPVDATATHCLLLQWNSDWFLPFLYRLTWVVPDNGPLYGCVCVCVLLGTFYDL